MRFVGYVASEDVPALFAAARVVVVPYTKVTQSSVLGTATVAGAPVIVTDLPGLREAAATEASLVPPADPDALATALARLLTDDELAGDLRDHQKRRGAEMEIDVVAARARRHLRRHPRGADSSRTIGGRSVPAETISPRPACCRRSAGWSSSAVNDSLYRNSSFLILNTAITAALGFVFWALASRFFPASEVGTTSTAVSALDLRRDGRNARPARTR